ncbi:MAG: hypothetical protein JW726_14710 [Anaerolineales bacterium]|nr:hypothetical protein [Anaerolineales bacterium]
MRINPEILHKLALDTVAQRTKEDRSILAAYLHGSLLGENPLMGNTADIDLVFVHNDPPAVEREIVRLSDEVHLDIAHHESKFYRQPRQLRLHPWMGPTLYHCRILYDPQHFMDFTQASVRGQFYHPANVLVRVRQQAEHARQIWLAFHLEAVEPQPCDMVKYLRAVDHAANSVVSLRGVPLAERRFLLDFPPYAEAVSRPGLYAGLLGLLGAPAVDADTLRLWLSQWERDYLALAPASAPPHLHHHRLLYYLRGMQALLEGDRPQTMLWPLWHTWTLIACIMAERGDAQLSDWQSAGERLGLLGASFAERVVALDAYLDLIEETLEEWGRENGAE